MIHYHGTPIIPTTASARTLKSRHALVSVARKDDIEIVKEVCQSFILDNGAFSAWKSGSPVKDWNAYYSWVDGLKRHPGFDFAIIPDVIDGDEGANDSLVQEWPHETHFGVPVWHMHESVDRLVRLSSRWPRVALGSSGEYSRVGTSAWWSRILEALPSIIDSAGYPVCKLHGLRMLDSRVFTKIPLSSADSSNVARNIGIDQKWTGRYSPPDKDWRALLLAERIESNLGAQKFQDPERTNE